MDYPITFMVALSSFDEELTSLTFNSLFSMIYVFLVVWLIAVNYLRKVLENESQSQDHAKISEKTREPKIRPTALGLEPPYRHTPYPYGSYPFGVVNIQT